VEGNGLYDASTPKGKYTFDIFKQQHIDVITSGNHELYLQNSSINEYYETVPNFKGSYIASNLDIQNPKNGQLEPLAPRYRKFTTKNQGIRVLSFGFLFNFHGNANNTVVQSVQETIKEKWYQDAIRTKDIDLFLVAGHVPLRDSPEYDLIYKSIRDVAWDTPIVFFGGHTHIRDYRKYDSKAHGIESGRYMETLGFLSIDGLSTDKKDSESVERSGLSYKRLYLDNNLYSMYRHSGTNMTTFPTELGKNVSNAITKARSEMKLDKTFGCAPHDYWLNRAPYPAEDSLLTWLEKQVIPDTFSSNKTPSIVITNSGAMRFDIFKGPFTTDTTFLVSPFTSSFRMLKNMPYKIASQVLQLLNNEGPITLEDLLALYGEAHGLREYNLEDLAPPAIPVSLSSRLEALRIYQPASREQIALSSTADDATKPSTPGYTTRDDAGADGDDTIHQAIDFYNVPNCIASPIAFDPASGSAPGAVDLVYNEFIQDWILLALRFLGETRKPGDTESALGGKTMTSVISEWVGKHWKCEK
jgi:hypothetical protein